MDIDEKAPVIARAEIDIAAGPATVFRLISRVDVWPSWKKDVRSVSLQGPVAPGSTFAWKAGPGTIRSTFQEVDAPRKIAWTGSTFGIRAIDVFRLDPHDGGTHVTEQESWSGFVVRLFRSRMRRTLQSSIEAGLRDLKAEAERHEAVGARPEAAAERPEAATQSRQAAAPDRAASTAAEPGEPASGARRAS